MIDDTEIVTIMNGFEEMDSPPGFRCTHCGESFISGYIYEVESQLCDARKAVQLHVKSTHGDRFEFLMAQGKAVHGLSDVQASVLLGKYRGESDDFVASSLGGRSASTVRNHRFQLQKKKREAEHFLALLYLLESREQNSSESYIKFHSDLPMNDDRALITHQEAAKIEEKHLLLSDKGLEVVKFPRKEKAKLVILRRIAAQFPAADRMSEAQVDDILKPMMSDYATLRRYLVEYRFLKRRAGGSEYWRDW